MKKIINIISGFFLVVAIIFAFLPLGTDPIGFLPIGIALALELVGLLFFSSKKGKKTVSIVLLTITAAVALVVLVRNLANKDEVVQDNQFEQQKEEAQKESIQELEELDGTDE
jgi:energy-coupling factor transporter transmembrane protein EcfT